MRIWPEGEQIVLTIIVAPRGKNFLTGFFQFYSRFQNFKLAYLQIFSRSIPVHVPKAARPEWARLLADVINSTVLDSENVSRWTRLLMLPKCILAAKCCKRQQQDDKSQAAVVKGRIKRWREGYILPQWKEAKSPKKTEEGREKKLKSKLRKKWMWPFPWSVCLNEGCRCIAVRWNCCCNSRNSLQNEGQASSGDSSQPDSQPRCTANVSHFRADSQISQVL